MSTSCAVVSHATAGRCNLAHALFIASLFATSVHGAELNLSRPSLEDQLEGVLDIWRLKREHPSSIFQASKTLTEIARDGRGKPGGLFSESRIHTVRPIEGRLVFAADRGKILFRFSQAAAQNKDGSLIARKNSAVAFDGTLYRRYLTEGRLTAGSLRTSMPADNPARSHVCVLPQLLWQNPIATIERLGWRIEKAVANQQEESGTNLVAIQLSKKGRRSSGLIDVDASNGLIHRCLFMRADQPSLEVRLKYNADLSDTGLPALQEWVVLTYNRKGDRESIHRGQVTESAIGKRIEDERFVLRFPDGAQITVHSDDGEIQCESRDGELHPIQPVSEPELGDLSAIPMGVNTHPTVVECLPN